MNQVSLTIRCLLPCALLALAACASFPSQQVEYPVGRVRLALPAGAWEDLGSADEAVRVNTGMSGYACVRMGNHKLWLSPGSKVQIPIEDDPVLGGAVTR